MRKLKLARLAMQEAGTSAYLDDASIVESSYDDADVSELNRTKSYSVPEIPANPRSLQNNRMLKRKLSSSDAEIPSIGEK